MKRMLPRFAVVAALGFLAAGARAQTGALDQVSQDPNKGAKSEARAAQAAAAASAAGGGTADVTFEQVLGAPDDVELNERYALTQIRKGDLRGAATTLERVLLNAPGRARTRLLYGVVLLRLDDAPDALRQLDAALASPDLPPEARGEAAAYRRIALSRLRDSHFDVRVTAGGGYDSNRNVAPDDSQALAFGTPVTVSPGPTADGNFQFVGTVGGSYDFDGPRGDTLFGRFTNYREDQRVVSLLSLNVYTPEAGVVIRTPWADVAPSYSFDYVDLSSPMSLYLRSSDYDLKISRRWSRALETWGGVADSRQVFHDTPLIPNGSSRSGDLFDYSLGAAWTPDPADRVALTLTHQRKLAVQVFNAYRREGFALDYTRLLGRGCFAVAGLTANFDRYEQPDPFVSPDPRRDDGWIPRAALGAPLDPLWSGLRGFTATLGFQYQMQSSSLPNYRYTNAELNALISYAWGI